MFISINIFSCITKKVRVKHNDDDDDDESGMSVWWKVLVIPFEEKYWKLLVEELIIKIHLDEIEGTERRGDFHHFLIVINIILVDVLTLPDNVT